eukprot:TRINITY_DN56456_c0_g1_i1.p1 TRINITY_DN56456_c0_g1~~TRINITY_DN56456_c0_g1_i1.p1  ORF type:complete len:491 (+),score=79.96 TRINITY_DN56456_c0_g1_i1:199-1473(+)
MVDNSQPYVSTMTHIRQNLKKEQMMEERYSEIDRHNRILLKKMSDIMNTPRSEGSGTPRVPAGTPRLGPVSLNRESRKKEMMRITRDNQKILSRIQKAQPTYSRVEWEITHARNTRYLKSIVEFPLVLRQARQGNLTSTMVPLDEYSLPKLDDIEASAQPAAKVVHKEGVTIDQSFYLVEMKLTGPAASAAASSTASPRFGALFVSAFDPETGQTRELMVEERLYRKLLRDANGDHSLLCERLRMEGSRLVMDDGPPIRPPPALSPDSGAQSPVGFVPPLALSKALPPPEESFSPKASPKRSVNASPKKAAPAAKSESGSADEASTFAADSAAVVNSTAEAVYSPKGVRHVTEAEDAEFVSPFLDADEMVACRVKPSSVGSVNAEIDLSASGELVFHLRGLTPTSREGSPMMIQSYASGFGLEA